MRISDWSSDVCSSDLIDVNKPRKPRKAEPSRPNQRMAQPWIGATCTSGQISMANKTVKPTQLARVIDAPIRAAMSSHTDHGGLRKSTNDHGILPTRKEKLRFEKLFFKPPMQKRPGS